MAEEQTPKEVSYFTDIPKAALHGAASMYPQAATILGKALQAIPGPTAWVGKPLAEFGESWQKRIEQVYGKPETLPGEIISGAISSIGPSVGYPLGIYKGLRLIGTAPEKAIKAALVGAPTIFGLGEARETYEDARAAGKSFLSALPPAVASGLVEGLGEAVGERILFKSLQRVVEGAPVKDALLKGATGKLLGITSPLMVEASTEFGQSFLESLIRESWVYERPFAEAVKTALAEGGMGAAQGALMAGITNAYASVYRRGEVPDQLMYRDVVEKTLEKPLPVQPEVAKEIVPPSAAIPTLEKESIQAEEPKPLTYEGFMEILLDPEKEDEATRLMEEGEVLEALSSEFGLPPEQLGAELADFADAWVLHEKRLTTAIKRELSRTVDPESYELPSRKPKEDIEDYLERLADEATEWLPEAHRTSNVIGLVRDVLLDKRPELIDSIAKQAQPSVTVLFDKLHAYSAEKAVQESFQVEEQPEVEVKPKKQRGQKKKALPTQEEVTAPEIVPETQVVQPEVVPTQEAQEAELRPQATEAKPENPYAGKSDEELTAEIRRGVKNKKFKPTSEMLESLRRWGDVEANITAELQRRMKEIAPHLDLPPRKVQTAPEDYITKVIEKSSRITEKEAEELLGLPKILREEGIIPQDHPKHYELFRDFKEGKVPLVKAQEAVPSPEEALKGLTEKWEKIEESIRTKLDKIAPKKAPETEGVKPAPRKVPKIEELPQAKEVQIATKIPETRAKKIPKATREALHKEAYKALVRAGFMGKQDAARKVKPPPLNILLSDPMKIEEESTSIGEGKLVRTPVREAMERTLAATLGDPTFKLTSEKATVFRTWLRAHRTTTKEIESKIAKVIGKESAFPKRTLSETIPQYIDRITTQTTDWLNKVPPDRLPAVSEVLANLKTNPPAGEISFNQLLTVLKAGSPVAERAVAAYGRMITREAPPSKPLRSAEIAPGVRLERARLIKTKYPKLGTILGTEAEFEKELKKYIAGFEGVRETSAPRYHLSALQKASTKARKLLSEWLKAEGEATEIPEDLDKAIKEVEKLRRVVSEDINKFSAPKVRIPKTGEEFIPLAERVTRLSKHVAKSLDTTQKELFGTIDEKSPWRKEAQSRLDALVEAAGELNKYQVELKDIDEKFQKESINLAMATEDEEAKKAATEVEALRKKREELQQSLKAAKTKTEEAYLKLKNFAAEYGILKKLQPTFEEVANAIGIGIVSPAETRGQLVKQGLRDAARGLLHSYELSKKVIPEKILEQASKLLDNPLPFKYASAGMMPDGNNLAKMPPNSASKVILAKALELKYPKRDFSEVRLRDVKDLAQDLTLNDIKKAIGYFGAVESLAEKLRRKVVNFEFLDETVIEEMRDALRQRTSKNLRTGEVGKNLSKLKSLQLSVNNASEILKKVTEWHEEVETFLDNFEKFLDGDLKALQKIFPDTTKIKGFEISDLGRTLLEANKLVFPPFARAELGPTKVVEKPEKEEKETGEEKEILSRMGLSVYRGRQDIGTTESIGSQFVKLRFWYGKALFELLGNPAHAILQRAREFSENPGEVATQFLEWLAAERVSDPPVSLVGMARALIQVPDMTGTPQYVVVKGNRLVTLGFDRSRITDKAILGTIDKVEKFFKDYTELFNKAVSRRQRGLIEGDAVVRNEIARFLISEIGGNPNLMPLSNRIVRTISKDWKDLSVPQRLLMTTVFRRMTSDIFSEFVLKAEGLTDDLIKIATPNTRGVSIGYSTFFSRLGLPKESEAFFKEEFRQTLRSASKPELLKQYEDKRFEMLGKMGAYQDDHGKLAFQVAPLHSATAAVERLAPVRWLKEYFSPLAVQETQHFKTNPLEHAYTYAETILGDELGVTFTVIDPKETLRVMRENGVTDDELWAAFARHGIDREATTLEDAMKQMLGATITADKMTHAVYLAAGRPSDMARTALHEITEVLVNSGKIPDTDLKSISHLFTEKGGKDWRENFADRVADYILTRGDAFNPVWGKVKKWFDKIKIALEKVYHAIRGDGFISPTDFIRSVVEGKYAKAPARQVNTNKVAMDLAVELGREILKQPRDRREIARDIIQAFRNVKKWGKMSATEHKLLHVLSGYWGPDHVREIVEIFGQSDKIAHSMVSEAIGSWFDDFREYIRRDPVQYKKLQQILLDASMDEMIYDVETLRNEYGASDETIQFYYNWVRAMQYQLDRHIDTVTTTMFSYGLPSYKLPPALSDAVREALARKGYAIVKDLRKGLTEKKDDDGKPYFVLKENKLEDILKDKYPEIYKVYRKYDEGTQKAFGQFVLRTIPDLLDTIRELERHKGTTYFPFLRPNGKKKVAVWLPMRVQYSDTDQETGETRTKLGRPVLHSIASWITEPGLDSKQEYDSIVMEKKALQWTTKQVAKAKYGGDTSKVKIYRVPREVADRIAGGGSPGEVLLNKIAEADIVVIPNENMIHTLQDDDKGYARLSKINSKAVIVNSIINRIPNDFFEGMPAAQIMRKIGELLDRVRQNVKDEDKREQFEAFRRFVTEEIKNVYKQQSFAKSRFIRRTDLGNQILDFEIESDSLKQVDKEIRAIAGFKEDPKEVLVRYIGQDARYLGRAHVFAELHYQAYSDSRLREHLQRDERFYDWFRKYVTSVFAPYSEGLRAINKMSLAMTGLYLGFKVSSAAINLTQMLATGVPELAAFVGANDLAMRAYHKSGRSVKRAFEKLAPRQAKAISIYSSAARDLLAKNLTKDELAALDRGIAEGAARAEYFESVMQEAYDTAGKYLRPALSKMLVLFRLSEEFSRKVGFLSGYRLARQQGLSHGEAIEFAGKHVKNAYFEYSKTHKPLMMLGSSASSAFFRSIGVLKGFVLNYLGWLYRNAKNTHGTTYADKAFMSLFYMTALGGLFANPLWELAELLAKLFGISLKQELAKASPNTFTYNLLGHGLFSPFGISLTGSIALNLIPRDLTMASALDALLGAPYGKTRAFERAKLAFDTGQYERMFEELLPAGISAALKGIRYLSGEPLKTIYGKPLLDESGNPVQLSNWEKFLTLFGFIPVTQAQVGDIYDITKTTESYFAAKRSKIYTMFKVRDPEDWGEIIIKVNSYNSEAIKYGGAIPLITPDSIARSVMDNRKADKLLLAVGADFIDEEDEED